MNKFTIVLEFETDLDASEVQERVTDNSLQAVLADDFEPTDAYFTFESIYIPEFLRVQAS